MNAIAYVDHFVHKQPGIQKEYLQVVAVVAIIVAVKLNEQVLLSLEQGVVECDNSVNVEWISNLEKLMLSSLWDVIGGASALDYLHLLLQIPFLDNDLSSLQEKCTYLIYLCLFGKTVS